MKKKTQLLFAFGMLVALLASATAAYAAPNEGKGGNGGNKGKATTSTALVGATINTTVSLSDAEVADLIFMREEEKLARDVYITLYNTWGVSVFNNIASSEQMHTDSIKGLLDAYGIADPVVNDTIGVFTNPELQALYNHLVATGSSSLVDALKVGAAIEEIDIADLYESMAETAQPNILQVYSSLLAGSENHLRSFVSTLSAQGVDYAPQYLSADTYNAIISSAMNTQNGNTQGQGGGRGGRR